MLTNSRYKRVLLPCERELQTKATNILPRTDTVWRIQTARAVLRQR